METRTTPAGLREMVMTPEPGALGEIHITRIFDAPRELVWQMWADPVRVMRWWGPEGYTAPSIQHDLRVGGRYLYCMRSPTGEELWSTGVYREVVPMARIVTSDSFADEDGHVVPGSYYGMSADWPLVTVLALTFEELGDKTRFTLYQQGIPAGNTLEACMAGWNSSLDKLAAALN